MICSSQISRSLTGTAGFCKIPPKAQVTQKAKVLPELCRKTSMRRQMPFCRSFCAFVFLWNRASLPASFAERRRGIRRERSLTPRRFPAPAGGREAKKCAGGHESVSYPPAQHLYRLLIIWSSRSPPWDPSRGTRTWRHPRRPRSWHGPTRSACWRRRYPAPHRYR